MALKSDTIGRILLSRYIICTHSRRNKDILLAALHHTEDHNTGGRMMPCHYGIKSYVFLRIKLYRNTISLAVGTAMSAKKTERMRLLYSSGEGTTSEGEF